MDEQTEATMQRVIRVAFAEIALVDGLERSLLKALEPRALHDFKGA